VAEGHGTLLKCLAEALKFPYLPQSFSANKDYVTRAAYLTMLQGLLLLDWPEDTLEVQTSLETICGVVIEMLSELERITGSYQLPCYVDFLSALGKILFKLR
jgi:hypothetical protein